MCKNGMFSSHVILTLLDLGKGVSTPKLWEEEVCSTAFESPLPPPHSILGGGGVAACFFTSV